MLVLAVWACVYPIVVIFDYIFAEAALDWPSWLTILIPTLVTVPVISFVVKPHVERVIARVREQTRAELKIDEARLARGPDPEEII